MTGKKIRFIHDENDTDISNALKYDVVLIVPTSGTYGRHHCILKTKENLVVGVDTPATLIAKGDMQTIPIYQMDFDAVNSSLSVTL